MHFSIHSLMVSVVACDDVFPGKIRLTRVKCSAADLLPALKIRQYMRFKILDKHHAETLDT
jgi:hypothetical protein